MVEYTYKIRIYPDDEQKTMFAKTFGCVRFVYNHFLEEFKNNNYVSKIDNNNICNKVLKNENEWLKEVDKFALTNSIYNLDNSCQRFMSKVSGYPKFKKKSSTQSYKTNFTNNNIEVLDGYIKLPKVGKVKAKIHREINGKIVNCTIKKYPSGKYYANILVRKEIQELDKNNHIVALDMGVKTFATTSDGLFYDAPKSVLKFMDKLKQEQQKLSRKLKGSSNFNKQRIKVARLYEKCDNIRNDYIHKLSKTIINENQVIIVEDLSVKEMYQNKMLSKVLGDLSISKFINLLEYKARFYNRQLIKINRYYPSSQLCSVCNYKNELVKDLSIRQWTCPSCSSIHNRDINASVNLLTKGLEYIKI